MNFGMELTPRCGCDLYSAAIISRAATGRVGSRNFQLPLWVASCSVRESPRPAVTLTLTWPRTFIMLHFATRAHDVPAFSSPAFSTPGNLVPCFPVLRFPPLRFGPTFSSPDFSSPTFSVPPFHSQSWLYYVSKGWFCVVLSSLCVSSSLCFQ